MPSDPLPRREFLKRTGAAALGVPAALHAAAGIATSNPTKLNIVLIVADDQRHDTVGALGNTHIQTPHLDALVRDGFSFTRARCMGSTVQAVCIPSRASLHTGRTLFAVPEDLGKYATIGQVFQQAGYNALGFGKWHNHTTSYARSFNSGGNIFFGGMHEQYHVPVHQYVASGKYAATDARVAARFSSELFTDPVISFLESGKATEKPFFCYLAFTSPHDPRTPPAPFDTLYDAATMPLPDNFLPAHPFDNGDMDVRDENLAPHPRTAADTRKQLCDYYGMVSSQDAQVGRVLQALEKTGQIDNTLVIYMGDHGLAIGSHGLFGKQNVYEHSTRIPLLMRGPGVPRGQKSDALIYGFDLFPTLCEMAGTPLPGSVEGKSLVGIIAGRDQRVRESAFHAYTHANGDFPADTQHAVTDGRWKTIRYDVKGVTRVQLFDLQNDPDEMHDLSSDAAAAAQLPRLNAELRRWRRQLAEPAVS